MSKPPVVSLAKENIPELNATFYQSNPAAHIRMRAQSLAMLLSEDATLEPAFQGSTNIGALTISGHTFPERSEREQYAALESTVIFHHAVETITRLFLAHKGDPECPWINVVDMTSFAEYKRIATPLREASGWDRTQVATVFLGGSSPEDAAIDVSQVDFDETVSAVIELLSHCVRRMLNDSFLYNSAKHGLSGLQLSGLEVSAQPDGQDPITLMKGQAIINLHKTRDPLAQRRHKAEWYLTTNGVLIDQDLILTEMVTRVLDSLWSVAHRRYLGEPGTIHLFKVEVIKGLIFQPVRHADQHIQAITYELSTTTTYANGNTTQNSSKHTLRPVDVPRDFVSNHVEGDPPLNGTPASVELPLRDRDRRAYTVSKIHALPFSPDESQIV